MRKKNGIFSRVILLTENHLRGWQTLTGRGMDHAAMALANAQSLLCPQSSGIPVRADIHPRCHRYGALMLPIRRMQCRPRRQNAAAARCRQPLSPVSSQERNLAKADLLDAIAGSNRGLIRTPSVKDRVMKSVHALKELGKDATTTDESLTATWRLLWTTEKETLFIFERAHIFGTEAGGTFQPIDVAGGTLRNVITFPPSGAFVVDAAISVASRQRVEFRFSRAELRLPRRTIGVPPFGRGWFDNVYMDEEVRISQDSRGDTLVTERAAAGAWQG